MARYTTVDSSTFITLDRLIEKLQAIQASLKSQGNVYVVGADVEYLTHVEVVEMICSDGSAVRDVRLVRK